MIPETFPFISDFAKKFLHQGRAEGIVEGGAAAKVEAVLAVLEARGFSVSEATRSRIAACADSATLDRWLRRAVTADDVDAVFE